MKRLLLLLGCVIACSSCLKNERFVKDQTGLGFDIYTAVYRQTVLATDPFNIAFRLNTLIVEGDGDYNAAPDAVRRKLISSGTTIAYDETQGIYTFVFNNSTITGDFTRKGTVRISTNGYETLSLPYARWEVFISEPYIVTSGDEIKMSSSTYTITNIATNRWQVSMSRFVSEVPPKTTNGVTVEFKSDWNVSYTIEQQTGTQNLESVKSSIFSVVTSAQNATTMYLPKDPLTVSTPIPFKYNPACSTTAPVGDGKMLIFVSKDANMENFTEAHLLGGEQLDVCYPKTRILYAGFQSDYQIQ